MAHVQILRAKKLSGGGIIAVAARHNLREIQAEMGADSHIDPSKTLQNVILRGAAQAGEVVRDAAAQMEAAKVEQRRKLRKDAVRGLEIIFSLPPSSGIAERDFFADAVVWSESFFELPILSAVIHNDEAAPHCHVILLPLFDGRMIGSRMMGNRSRLLEMQANFFEKVGGRYGLERQAPVKRYSRAARTRAAEIVVNDLRKNPKRLDDPAIRDAVRDALVENPMPAMGALGFEMPQPKAPKPKTFAVIMTKHFKHD
ncbi:plasmid recombination protein [Sideroxydans sp.]